MIRALTFALLLLAGCATPPQGPVYPPMPRAMGGNSISREMPPLPWSSFAAPVESQAQGESVIVPPQPNIITIESSDYPVRLLQSTNLMTWQDIGGIKSGTSLFVTGKASVKGQRAVELEWDASSTPGVMYRIYCDGKPFDAMDLTYTIAPCFGLTNRFTVVAVKDGVESVPSNEVVYVAHTNQFKLNITR